MYPQYTKATQAQAKRIIESWASLQWKVIGHHFTRLDLIQEGYIVFTKIADRYPDRSEDHILSTLARSLQNRSRDLAAKPDRLPAVTDLSADDQDSIWEPEFEHDFDQERPSWLDALVEFARTATVKQLSVISGPNGDAFLAKHCGLSPKLPLKRMVKEALA